MTISNENADRQPAVKSVREEQKSALAKAVDVGEKAQDAMEVGTELHRAQRASDGPPDEEMSSLNRAEDQALYNLESAADAAAKDVRIKKKQVGKSHRPD